MVNTQKLVTTRSRKKASDRHPIAIAFGECLKQARIAANKSQSELAFDASIDRTYVSLLERGLASPTLLVLVDLAKSMGLSTTELIAGFEAHLSSQRVRKARTKRRINEAALDNKSSRPPGSRRSPLR
jgi:transcriptional regulator with XRE-family HTH domain